MVLIDTTVWIDFFKGWPTLHVAALEDLIQNDSDMCLYGRIG